MLLGSNSKHDQTLANKPGSSTGQFLLGMSTAGLRGFDPQLWLKNPLISRRYQAAQVTSMLRCPRRLYRFSAEQFHLPCSLTNNTALDTWGAHGCTTIYNFDQEWPWVLGTSALGCKSWRFNTHAVFLYLSDSRLDIVVSRCLVVMPSFLTEQLRTEMMSMALIVIVGDGIF